MNCEQTLNNTYQLASTIANVQGNDTSNIHQIKGDLTSLINSYIEMGQVITEMNNNIILIKEEINSIKTSSQDTNSVSKAILSYLNKVQSFLKI